MLTAYRVLKVLTVWGILVLNGCGTDIPAPVPIPAPDYMRLGPEVRDYLLASQNRLFAARDSAGIKPHRVGLLYGEQGRRYLAYGLEEPAYACFLNALSFNPADYRWSYYLGYLLQKEGRLEESREHYRRALELRPEYLPAYSALADLLTKAEDWAAAEDLLERLLELDSDSVSARLGLSQLASARKEYDRAIGLLEEALRQAPEDGRIYYPLGMAYRARGDMEKARYFLGHRGAQGGRRYDPLLDNLGELFVGARGFNYQGIQAFFDKRYAKAKALYEKAVSMEPDNQQYRMNLASAYAKQGAIDQALKQFREVLFLDPAHAEANYNTAVILADQNRVTEALSHYRRALDADPNHVQARFNLADTLLRLGRIEEAVEHFGHSLSLDPLIHAARYRQASALGRLSRWQEALSTIEDGFRIQPDDAKLTDTLARLLAACPVDTLRDGSRALKLAQRLNAQQRTVISRETLAMAMAEEGHFPNALRLQEAALKALGSNERPEIKNRLQTNLALYRAGKPCRQPFGP